MQFINEHCTLWYSLCQGTKFYAAIQLPLSSTYDQREMLLLLLQYASKKLLNHLTCGQMLIYQQCLVGDDKMYIQSKISQIWMLLGWHLY